MSDEPQHDSGASRRAADVNVVVRCLMNAVEGPTFDWSLCVVGEDQWRGVAELTNSLKQRPDFDGNGKKIFTGYRYWGTRSTMAWIRACQDPFYVVMNQSLESFADRWRQLHAALGRQAFHLVSLGPGSGNKDVHLLEDLFSIEPQMFYLPVDISQDMLRESQRLILRHVGLRGHQVIPMQMDFFNKRHLTDFRRLAHQLVGAEPVLFSLLGNTVANFDDDMELLRRIRELLRPQDRLLVEVATTARLTMAAGRAAADEYAKAVAFRRFALTTLMTHTDLPMRDDWLRFRSLLEPDHAICVKGLYVNDSGRDITFTGPDGHIEFPDGDTICVCMARKYLISKLPQMFGDAGFEIESRISGDMSASTGFGNELLFLRLGGRPAKAEANSDPFTPPEL